MKKKYRQIGLLFYFILSLTIMDSLLKNFTFGNLSNIGTLYSFLFTITISLLTYTICSLFQEKMKYLLSTIFMLLFGVIYASQLAYYKFFKTFYVLYSIAKGSQVMEFWRDILFLFTENVFLIFLFFIPGLLLLLFGKKLFSYEYSKKSPLITILFVILFHSISLASLYIGGTQPQSSFDLYFRENQPTLSIARLGLLTTMRLDLQKLVFGNSLNPFTSSLPKINHVQAEEVDIEEETEEEIAYNTMNIDFDTLIANEKNEEIKNIHEYISRVEPTEKNEYTGIYKGYNLIFITAEGFSPYAVRSDVTPTLYKMVHQGYYFSNFYTPLWDISTTDGEYAASTGLLPKSGVWSYFESSKNHMPFAMGNQLKALGYKTMAYHNHTYDYYKRHISHPNMGYDYKGVGNGLKVKKVWPASDLEMMENTIDEYITQQPFHAYYMTVSGHLRYSFTGNSMAAKNKKLVQDLPYSNESKAYIATQIELDRALEHLEKKLEEFEIADKTLIVLSADHYPYGLEEKSMNELAGHEVEKNFEQYKSNLIIYTKGMKPRVVDKLSSSVDIIPTISNLLGLEYDSRLLIGRDIFSNADPLVIFLNRSFITEKGRFHSENMKFQPIDNTVIDEDYVKRISAQVNNAFYYSSKILDTDYYKKVLPK